jgi:RNA polymerase sigma-70 factor (ECF subfamily)
VGRRGEEARAGAEADLRLVEDYLAGRAEAFEEIEGWILREIDRRYLWLRSEREDLCQSVHEKLLRNLRSGSFGHRSTLRTYVAALTHHSAIDRLRRIYREARLHPSAGSSLLDPSANPYDAVEQTERTRLLHRVVSMSPQICRSMWKMIFLERLPYGEVARRLGIPAGTVKSRMWHCRRKALALLGRLERVRGGA